MRSPEIQQRRHDFFLHHVNPVHQCWADHDTHVTVVPEPGTMALIGTGLLSASFARRKKIRKLTPVNKSPNLGQKGR
jgi:hypothetical protein